LNGSRTRSSRLVKWSAAIAIGAFVVVACRPDDPTPAPTEAATEAPSTVPLSASIEPSAEPTAEPTPEPTAEPTPEPTAEPTPEPTAEPTAEPSIEPTAEPSVEPTAEPSVEPTAEPSVEPTAESSVEPAVDPSTEPTDEPAVDGTIVLPAGTTLDEGAEWTIEVQDTSLADAPAIVVGQDGGTIDDPSATEIEFAAPYDAAAIDERNTYTLSARIVDADGNLLYANDTSIPVITSDAPSDDVDVPVIEVPASSPAVSEAPTE
jgi:uncharacterized lipoprotein YbaY